MFLAETLTVLVAGLKQVFDSDFPKEEFQNLPVGIEYPEEPSMYPSVWVDLELAGPLTIAGVGHEEFLEREVDGDVRFDDATRWTFEGTATFTAVSLSALTRARIVDELIRTLGFGETEGSSYAPFRNWLATNPHIGITMNHDELSLRGMAATQGTPWGSDDVIYEATVTAEVLGEFTSTPQGLLVPLRQIEVTTLVDDEETATVVIE